MLSSGRRALCVGSLLLAALASAGAEDAEQLAIAPRSARGPSSAETPRVEAQKQSPARPLPPVNDPWEALSQPLTADETEELASLAVRLGAPTVEARDRAARAIKARFGARAAGPLLQLAERDLDCERRFRERALVQTLVFDHFLDNAPNCGWLGIRWTGSSTEKHYFAAHVVEAVGNEPAARGGIKANDDIVSWNGTPIENQLDFIDRVQSQAPGTVAELVVERDGQEVRIHVTMGTRTDSVTHLPELPYPTFQRDMAHRQVARWLDAWKKRR